MIHTYFENIENEIISIINSAERRIYVAVAWFTNQELFDSIVKAAERNVNIKLLLLDDILNRNEFGLDFGILIEKGVDVRFANDKSGTMHHKFCIIDKVVITGSYNWTYHANKNDENILMTDEESVVNNYRMEFDRLFGSASPIAQPYEHLNWTEIKEGDFTEYRREIYREVIDKDDIHKEVKKNKLISLNKAYKSGNNEELAKASLLATEQRLRTITDVLTSRSQDFTYQLWKENSAGKPFCGHRYKVGKWWYVPSCIKEDKYHREYIEGELRTNASRDDVWFVKGLNLKIYDEQFISDIKNVLGSNTLPITNWKSIPDRMHRMLRIDLAKMFYYQFPTPMFNKKQQRSRKNSMPRIIPAINVLGIIKEVNDGNEVFYEGWDPKKRGEMIMNRFFVKQL
jgi:hypothetical protein